MTYELYTPRRAGRRPRSLAGHRPAAAVQERPACPECGRRSWTEEDASSRAGGKHTYRSRRTCLCGHVWTVVLDPETGEERGEDFARNT